MKYTAWLALLVLLSHAAWAQRGAGGGMGGHRGGGGGAGMRGGGQGGYRHGGTPAAPAPAPAPAAPRAGSMHVFTPNTYGSPLGYGNVVFPGTGHMPGTYSPFSIVDPSFGTRLTNTVSGFGYPYGYSSGYYGGGYGYGYRAPAVVPYAVPVYVPYQDPYAAAPPPPPAPPVIIYVVSGPPSTAVVTTAPQQPQNGVVTYVVPPRNSGATESTAPRLILIALKNSSIYSAAEYWVEDDTLHYVTSHGVQNQVSLDQVDLELTKRLNRERGLDFRLNQ
ncbi:MAG: hypothetical protein HY238_04725 [Acidobacteria bacterium]|nr:hypothetical protein [Acidobacteriota bacterium]